MYELTNEDREILKLHNDSARAVGMNEKVWSKEYFARNIEHRCWLRAFYHAAKASFKSPVQLFPRVGDKVKVNYSYNKVPATVTRLSCWDDKPAFVTDVTHGLYIQEDLGKYWWPWTEQDTEIEKLKAEIKKLKDDLVQEKARTLSSDTSIKLQIANDKLKVWEEECKPLHDYMVKNYPMQTWGRSVPAKALEIIETTNKKLADAMEIVKDLEKARHDICQARLVTLNADSKIADLGLKAYNIINADASVAPLKVGDKVWSVPCTGIGREISSDTIPSRDAICCTVIDVNSESFCLDKYVTRRFFADKDKTWWDNKPEDVKVLKIGDEVWTVPLCSLDRNYASKNKVKEIKGGEFWLESLSYYMPRKISDLGKTWFYEKP